MDAVMRQKIDQACSVAEEFTKLYFESIDKRRHLMSKLYHDTAILTWNGNGICGNEAIQNFIVKLPSTIHEINTLDSQPVTGAAVNGQLTFMIQVGGVVKYQDKIPKSFYENFVITACDDKWKIVSDCFRLQEPVNRN